MFLIGFAIGAVAGSVVTLTRAIYVHFKHKERVAELRDTANKDIVASKDLETSFNQSVQNEQVLKTNELELDTKLSETQTKVIEQRVKLEVLEGSHRNLSEQYRLELRQNREQRRDALRAHLSNANNDSEDNSQSRRPAQGK